MYLYNDPLPCCVILFMYLYNNALTLLCLAILFMNLYINRYHGMSSSTCIYTISPYFVVFSHPLHQCSYTCTITPYYVMSSSLCTCTITPFPCHFWPSPSCTCTITPLLCHVILFMYLYNNALTLSCLAILFMYLSLPISRWQMDRARFSHASVSSSRRLSSNGTLAIKRNTVFHHYLKDGSVKQYILIPMITQLSKLYWDLELQLPPSLSQRRS